MTPITITIQRPPLRHQIAWYTRQFWLYAARPFTRSLTADEWYATGCPPYAGQRRPWL
jgi:hypothetical protein